MWFTSLFSFQPERAGPHAAFSLRPTTFRNDALKNPLEIHKSWTQRMERQHAV